MITQLLYGISGFFEALVVNVASQSVIIGPQHNDRRAKRATQEILQQRTAIISTMEKPNETMIRVIGTIISIVGFALNAWGASGVPDETPRRYYLIPGHCLSIIGGLVAGCAIKKNLQRVLANNLSPAYCLPPNSNMPVRSIRFLHRT